VPHRRESFASNLHRVTGPDASYALDSKVALVGDRAQERRHRTLARSGQHRVPDVLLVGPREIGELCDERVVIISPGFPGRAAVCAAGAWPPSTIRRCS